MSIRCEQYGTNAICKWKKDTPLKPPCPKDAECVRVCEEYKKWLKYYRKVGR